jgi:hypothetical protein
MGEDFLQNYLGMIGIPKETTVKIMVGQRTLKIQNMLTNEEITGVPSMASRIWGRQTIYNNSFEIKGKPHSYLVLKAL